MAENTSIVVSDTEESAGQGTFIPLKHETREKKNGLRKIGRRFRDPFNKRKVEELKQEKDALKATVKDLISKLACTLMITADRGPSLIGSVGCFQIDCTNTVHQSSEDGLETLHERFDKLTDSVSKLVEELTTENIRRARENDEIKGSLECSKVAMLAIYLDRYKTGGPMLKRVDRCFKRVFDVDRLQYGEMEMKIDELKDLVSQCTSKIGQCNNDSSQALKDLKGFQEALLNNLPDEKVISDGISAIKLGLIFDDEYDFLPYAAKLLVTRLVHLFGHRGLIPLCDALKMEITDDIIESGYDEESMPSDDDNLKLLLDKDICARIIVKWVNKSMSNDSTALLNIVQSYERQRFRQDNVDYFYMSGRREDAHAKTVDQDKDSAHCKSLRSLSEQRDDSSSGTSLSIDENYYTYSRLEMDALHLLKLLSVEGLEV